MAKLPIGSKPVSTALAAASAVGIPLGGAAAQAAPPLSGTTISVEGGVAFSEYWRTTFPGNPDALLPGVSSSSDKTGSAPISSAPLQSNNNIGGYGSFSIGRDYDAMLDWRFAAAYYGFGTTSSSASASQFFSGSETSFTNTASITESDRFSFETFDFDFGHKWTTGPVQFRAFAGLRGLHTDESFTTDTATTGSDKIAFETFETTNTNVLTQGSSQYLGIGPRAGLDFSTVGTWGLVGSASAAFIEGTRQGDYIRSTTTFAGGGPSTLTTTEIWNTHGDWVGNLEGMIGVTWQFSSNGQFIAGYRADQWYNIRDSFGFAGFDNKQNILTQTPFLKVTLRY
jgi:hypothetical protein